MNTSCTTLVHELGPRRQPVELDVGLDLACPLRWIKSGRLVRHAELEEHALVDDEFELEVEQCTLHISPQALWCAALEPLAW